MKFSNGKTCENPCHAQGLCEGDCHYAWGGSTRPKTTLEAFRDLGIAVDNLKRVIKNKLLELFK